MIMYAYTLYDKKTKAYTPPQVHKDSPDNLKEAYERMAKKDVSEIKKFRDMVLIYIGTFDDTKGIISYVNYDYLVDFDSLFLDYSEEVNNE